jgi:hypothetical protein
MSGETVIHIDILSDAQKKVLPTLAKALANTDFYLVGGTALALQVGHRQSMDFDWFIPKLGDPETLFKRLKSLNIVFEIQSISYETVYLNIDTIQMSFIGYEYPMLQPKVLWTDLGVHLAGMNDIACMKLSAIASRGSRKDFLDLHYLIKHFLSLDDYLRLYMKKYKNRDIGHVVRSLVYFADAETEPDIKMIKPLVWQDLKSDFEKWVKDLKVIF